MSLQITQAIHEIFRLFDNTYFSLSGCPPLHLKLNKLSGEAIHVWLTGLQK